MAGAISLLPLHAFMAWTGIYFLLVYNPLYPNAAYSVCTVNCIDFNIVDRFGKVNSEYILKDSLLFKDVTGVAVLNDTTLATKIKFARTTEASNHFQVASLMNQRNWDCVQMAVCMSTQSHNIRRFLHLQPYAVSSIHIWL
jgi:hypothetical protein